MINKGAVDMRAVAYIRCAAKPAESATHQAAIESWAARACVDITSWHVDVGVSAATPIAERPGLLAAYRAIRAHGANVLVAANAEQFSHDELVSWLIEQAALTERAALETADGSRRAVPAPAEVEVGFSRGAVDLARAYDQVTTRSRIRTSLADKRARNERIGNVPFGYRLAADGVHTEPDETEQTVLSTVRQLSAEGLSQRAIVSRLAERGIAGRTGAMLGQTQIARILRSA